MGRPTAKVKAKGKSKWGEKLAKPCGGLKQMCGLARQPGKLQVTETWQRAKGMIMAHMHREEGKDASRPSTCRPWVNEKMPLLEHEEACEN